MGNYLKARRELVQGLVLLLFKFHLRLRCELRQEPEVEARRGRRDPERTGENKARNEGPNFASKRS